MFTAYWNDDRKITVDFSPENNDPTVVDDVLPPELRGDQVSKESFEDFWQGGFIAWLVSSRFVEDSQKGSKKIPVHLKWTDYVHFDELGIVGENQKVDHQRLRGLVKIIASHWQDKPQIGMIHGLIQKGFDLEAIEAAIDRMTNPYTGKIDKNLIKLQPNTSERQLAKIMMPPECRRSNTVAVTKDQSLHWMKWARRLPIDHVDFKKPEFWRTDLKTLAILDQFENIDNNRAEQISIYIWSHRNDDPDFDQLLQWLKSQDKNKSNTQQILMDNLKRKKKLERKQKKLK